MKGNNESIYPFMKSFPFLLGLIFLLSCNKASLSPDEYVKWVNDPGNGLTQEKVIDQYKFQVQYRPAEYMVLQENPDANMQRPLFDSLCREYKGMQYFVMKIGSSKGSQDALNESVMSEQEYFNRIQYFTSFAQKDIHLIDGQDTLECLMYHFERSFSLTPYSTLLVAFENKKRDTQKILSFNEQVLGIGTIQFLIEEKNIHNIPQIDL